jgi:regulator of protease activity HflC (stomatin/prohibitin superfamily)
MANHGPRVINLNFNRPSAAQIAAIFIGALLIVLLIAVLLTSYYTVGAESEGVVLRFGKFLRTGPEAVSLRRAQSRRNPPRFVRSRNA